MLAACHVGPQVDEAGSDLGRQPQGAYVTVAMNRKVDGQRTEHQGELLVVRDDGLVILTPKIEPNDSSVVLIPWSTIYRARANERPKYSVLTSKGDSQLAASIDKLRLLSRFPQGLSVELTEQLLAHYDQAALGTLE